MTASTPRALIAEDDTLVAAVIQDTLEQIGIDVIGTAADGAQAVEMTRRLQPDVVLMDIEMPEMDGLIAAQRIQEDCPTPIVILTVYTEDGRLQQAAAAGVGAYLLKPPDPGSLERAITIARARFEDMRELRRLNAELLAYDHSVSHDLKSPLGSIFTTAEFLAEEYHSLSGRALESWLREIASQAQRAINIIESLLLLGRPAEISLEPLDMSSIVTVVQSGLALVIERTQTQISVPETWPPAYGHPLLVERVWDNYLSNAIKYGGNPPRVELGGDLQANGQARFWVRDNGRGISAEERALLFKPFVRLTPADTGGYGLGLFLARRIVEQLGGQVGIESHPGAEMGSVFYFTLPAFAP